MASLTFETNRSQTPVFANAIGDAFPLCMELPDAMQRLLRRLAETEALQSSVARREPIEEGRE